MCIEPMLEGESSKLEERGEPPYCEGEENQSSSGLSASSDSLTDVRISFYCCGHSITCVYHSPRVLIA